jgi:hypothetical protein
LNKTTVLHEQSMHQAEFDTNELNCAGIVLRRVTKFKAVTGQMSAPCFANRARPQYITDPSSDRGVAG